MRKNAIWTLTTDQGAFTQTNSAAVIIPSDAAASNPRLARMMAVLLCHLHAAVKEIVLTETEWLEAIKFLTATGKTSLMLTRLAS